VGIGDGVGVVFDVVGRGVMDAGGVFVGVGVLVGVDVGRGVGVLVIVQSSPKG